ncbi:hypothetical protein GYM41_002847 [Escherichia coli]|nr:hypothetical protein [Escherichia coli]EGO6589512.1 hypothetical protein [Escherichia coli]
MRAKTVISPPTVVLFTVSRKVVAAGDCVNRQFMAEHPDQLWVADNSDGALL